MQTQHDEKGQKDAACTRCHEQKKAAVCDRCGSPGCHACLEPVCLEEHEEKRGFTTYACLNCVARVSQTFSCDCGRSSTRVGLDCLCRYRAEQDVLNHSCWYCRETRFYLSPRLNKEAHLAWVASKFAVRQ